MSTTTQMSSRGRTWFQALADKGESVATGLGSVVVAEATWGGERVRLLAIVPDPRNRFPRARQGELGLDEGWALAHHVREAIAADHSGVKRPIIAIVDVQSQAYGRLESLLGIHLSLAAAADAYATARMAGHPVVALIVGTALSGGLLGHGDQAHHLSALDDPKVIVRRCESDRRPRVTRRTVEELDRTPARPSFPCRTTSGEFAKSSACCTGFRSPRSTRTPLRPRQIAEVEERVAAAIADVRRNPGDLTSRLNNSEARVHRAASIEVRRRLIGTIVDA